MPKKQVFVLQALPSASLQLHPPINDNPNVEFRVVDKEHLGPGEFELVWPQFEFQAPFRAVVSNKTPDFQVTVLGGMYPLILGPGKSVIFFWNGHEFIDPNTPIPPPPCDTRYIEAVAKTVVLEVPDPTCGAKAVVVESSSGSGLMTLSWAPFSTHVPGFHAVTVNNTDPASSFWALRVVFPDVQDVLLAPGQSLSAFWNGRHWHHQYQ